jgi:hypothetical protein
MSTPDEHHPSGPATNDELIDLLERLATRGWASDFHVQPGGRVVCGHCDSLIPARSLDTAERHRIDIDTDPADQMLVVTAACPRCSSRGTLVCGYGPAAGIDDAAVLAELPTPPGRR